MRDCSQHAPCELEHKDLSSTVDRRMRARNDPRTEGRCMGGWPANRGFPRGISSRDNDSKVARMVGRLGKGSPLFCSINACEVFDVFDGVIRWKTRMRALLHFRRDVREEAGLHAWDGRGVISRRGFVEASYIWTT